MRLSQLAGCVIAGIFPLLVLPVLPTLSTIQGCILGAIAISFSRYVVLRYLALTILFLPGAR